MKISRFLNRFRRSEEGTVMTEALISLPVLIWAFLAMFVYWDAFRSVNVSQKAAYNIADLLSRQSSVDLRFLDGMQSLLTYLTPPEQNARIRITSIEYDADEDRFITLFSYSPGRAMPELDDTTVNVSSFTDRIPLMSDGHSVLVVETQVDYNPAFDAGITPQVMEEFVVTRPRVDTTICLSSGCPV